MKTDLNPHGAVNGRGGVSLAPLPIVFRAMDSAVTTGAFTLGGVIIGGTLDWARASIAARRAKAGQRDELIAALGAAGPAATPGTSPDSDDVAEAAAAGLDAIRRSRLRPSANSSPVITPPAIHW